MNKVDQERFMRRALELARNGWGTTHPNPMVGAVIVENDRIVAEGWHAYAGGHHAETAALKNLGRPPKPNATLFVTLEPCSTVGRVAACTNAIIQSGIQNVVIGTIDPNPKHAERGIEILREAGVNVNHNILTKACIDLNLIYNHWITTGTPLLAAKIATTLDGHIATRTGDSKWITGEEARADVMRWRRLFPAIAVGAGTVLADNPRLTSRAPGEEWSPIRFVFDRSLRTVVEPLPNLYTDSFRDRTIVVSSQILDPEKIKTLEAAQVSLWPLPEQDTFANFRKHCQQNGITGVLFEGGATLINGLWTDKMLDYLFAYRAPKILGDDLSLSVFRDRHIAQIKGAVTLENIEHASFGSDQLLRGRIVYSSN